MIKLIAFFRNKWTKRCFSFISLGYIFFLIWLVWLNYAHFLLPRNAAALFILYLFIDILFGMAMIYTRKQFSTCLAAFLSYPVILILLFLTFGNWYLLFPLFIINTIVFLLIKSGKTLKIVLGVIYLIFFVTGILGYLILQMLSIKFFDTDMNLRSPDYIYSPNGNFRLVKYVDEEQKENRAISYYVEDADKDLSFWFLDALNFAGSVKVLTSPYARQPDVKWLENTKLLIDGKVKDISKGSVAEPQVKGDFSGETSILIPTENS